MVTQITVLRTLTVSVWMQGTLVGFKAGKIQWQCPSPAVYDSTVANEIEKQPT